MSPILSFFRREPVLCIAAVVAVLGFLVSGAVGYGVRTVSLVSSECP